MQIEANLLSYKRAYQLSGAMAGGFRPSRSNGPSETRRDKDSGEEELVICDGEMNIHP